MPCVPGSRRTSIVSFRLAGFLAVCLLVPSRAGRGDPPPPDDGGELAALIAEAESRSPELRAARDEASAARHRISPAGALPDPLLTLWYENDGAAPTLGTEPMSRLSVMALQGLPFPGKLRLASDAARASAARAETRPERVRLSLRAAVTRAYADLLEAREDLRLDDEQIASLRGIEEVTRSRYAAGMGNQQDVLRAQGELTRLLQQKRRDEGAERIAAARLGGLLFRPSGEPVPTARRLTPGTVPPLPPAAGAVESALARSPELRDAALAAEKARVSYELAKKGSLPDFVAQAGYSYRGALPLMWSAGVGVTIPVFNGSKQKPLVAEAESLRQAAASTEAALRRRLASRTEERLARLEQIADETRLDAEGLLVQDRLAVEAALASYRTGGVPFVTVLEALGTTFSDRRAAAGRLAGFLRAEADLEELSIDDSLLPPPMNASAGASAAPRM